MWKDNQLESERSWLSNIGLVCQPPIYACKNKRTMAMLLETCFVLFTCFFGLTSLWCCWVHFWQHIVHVAPPVHHCTLFFTVSSYCPLLQSHTNQLYYAYSWFYENNSQKFYNSDAENICFNHSCAFHWWVLTFQCNTWATDAIVEVSRLSETSRMRSYIVTYKYFCLRSRQYRLHTATYKSENQVHINHCCSKANFLLSDG